MIRTGIVGAGFSADFHYDSLIRAHPTGVEVVGVYSKTPAHREAFASTRGIRACTSLEELLDNVDVIHVCVPPAVHEPVTIAALQRDISVIVEKPFTGYFGPPGVENFCSYDINKTLMRTGALRSAKAMVDAEKSSKGTVCYAENWVFAPVIQKEVEVIRKTKAQLLWIIAEESHSGSHSPTYGIWKYSGGGSIVGKASHPLTTALYLKRVEGQARSTSPIRPKSVTARTHELTRLPGYEDRGYLRTDYTDVEDFGFMHVGFEDGTIADVFSAEIVLGGVHNWLEVFANNHRTRCNINPIDGLETYNPSEEQFKDVYVVEKIGTKQGWSKPAPDENWMTGYVQELAYFYQCISDGIVPYCGAELGFDSVSVMYSAYLSAENGGAETEVLYDIAT